MTLLCLIGLHDIRCSQRYVPENHYGKILEEDHFIAKCARCGWVKDETHNRWNGHDFVPIQESEPKDS
jgi:hypothetical protein